MVTTTNAKSARKPAKGRSAKAKAEVTVVSTAATKSGNGMIASFSDGSSMVLSDWQFPASVQKASKRGTAKAVFTAAVAAVPKPAAKLAHGVDSRNSPHSAKAVADNRAAAAKGKPAKAPKAPKAAKADKAKQPSRGVDRDYTLGATKNTAKEGTWRHHMLTVICKHKDTAAAKAAHAKSGKFSSNKLDFNWANAQGYIKFAK